MQNQPFKPEVLVPAGSLEKLKAATLYGADAVYLAGQKFGLRAASDNFTEQELETGIAFAHKHGTKAYVVLNGFLHDRDLEELPDFVRLITDLKADAVIVSDLGVITSVQSVSDIPIHLSTQASCNNLDASLFWKKVGVKRLILGRETSISDASMIKRETGLEVELFIHGSMCMAFSGNCVISNFTQGRDSNRGGCSQSCRFNYSLKYENGEKSDNTFFLSSKDLNGLKLIPDFFAHEIDSLKIEGRMRSPLYAGSTAKIYRAAIDAYYQSPEKFNLLMNELNTELEMIPHREYAQGSLADPANIGSVYTKDRREEKRNEYLFLGQVAKVIGNQSVLVEVRSQFKRSDEIEIMTFAGDSLKLSCNQIQSIKGDELEIARTSTMVRIPHYEGASVGQILRKSVLQ